MSSNVRIAFEERIETLPVSNLLPLNAAAGIPYSRPSDERVNAFARILADAGMIVSVRKSRGRDIRAACGQLIVEGEKKTAGQKAAANL